MQHVRHALPTALIAAALAAGTAACGSMAPGNAYTTGTAASPTASPHPLAKLTADQIVTTALNDLKSATGVRIAGTMNSSGQTISLDLTLVQGKGCSGSMSLAGKGSFKLVYLDKKIWIKPDDQFYKSVGGGAALSLMSGKWLKPSENSGLSDFSVFCTASGLAGSFAKNAPKGLSKSVSTPVNGQPTVKIEDIGDSAAMYVSDTATPEILRITGSGSDSGNIDFSGYGATVPISVPPASQTIDGSQFGF